ncbi:hypothetical protein ROZALSC1DRAFT_21706 [Rozella allomycis CSF55]|uniref:Dynein heavy chain domain-containing protein n=1 Tax=Rozella allomycis (strain CSF55) TaxID=988480 RepID=A0A4P9YKU4_ROZAC|nr:hypothetical protein ROZALSC1DRAFT_21706 [Rozella allomycis CSF55]
MDASNRIENLANENNVKLSTIAMGSNEGFQLAEKSILNSSFTGDWTLLKNIHHCSNWLSTLERKLSFKSKSSKLFMTCNLNQFENNKIPVSLIRISRIVLIESPPGIKAALYSTIKEKHFTNPIEKHTLIFLLSWFQSVIEERLLYVPIGFSKNYEFNDSDYDFAIKLINNSINKIAKNKTNIDPNSIPFDSIKSILSSIVYGVLDRKDKHTNRTRFLLNCFNAAEIPLEWKMFPIQNISLDKFLNNLNSRFIYFSNLNETMQIDFGCLFNPQAFLTASRQLYAKKLNVSLENLCLNFSFIPSNDSLVISNLYLSGAKVNQNGSISVANELMNLVPHSYVDWVCDDNSCIDKLKVPLYRDNSRSELICVVYLPADGSFDSFYQNGVALLASNI